MYTATFKSTPSRTAVPGDQRHRQADLQGPTAKHEGTHLSDQVARQLQADEEHEEDDADLPHLLDQFEVVDQAKRVGTHNDTSNEVADDGDETDPLRDIAEECRCSDGDRQFLHEGWRSYSEDGYQCRHAVGPYSVKLITWC